MRMIEERSKSDERETQPSADKSSPGGSGSPARPIVSRLVLNSRMLSAPW